MVDKPEFCRKGPEGKHEVDCELIHTSYDGGTYVDVICKHCGREGCMGSLEALARGITWDDEEALTEDPPIAIDLLTHIAQCYPRILWQQLFNAYRDAGCSLTHMDNLLIDLATCQDVFTKYLSRRSKVRLLWTAHAPLGRTRFRELDDDDSAKQVLRMWDVLIDVAVLVEVTDKQITLTRLEVPK